MNIRCRMHPASDILLFREVVFRPLPADGHILARAKGLHHDRKCHRNRRVILKKVTERSMFFYVGERFGKDAKENL